MAASGVAAAAAAPGASCGGTVRLSDGVDMHYDLHGDSSSPQKLLLIMGLLSDGAAWAPQSEYFGKKGYHVVTYDNRGVAFTSTPGLTQLHTYTTEQMARDALQLATHLGWEQFHCVGVSMGGMIAMQLALQAPQRLRSLTLVVTHAGGFGGLAPWSGVGRMIVSIFSQSEETRLQAIMRMLYSQETLRNPDLSATLQQHHVARMATRIPPKFAAVLGHTLAVYRHYLSYANLLRIRYSSFPTMVMVGEEDQLVRVANSRMLSRVLGAKMVVVPHGGHGLMAEYPELVNEALSKFFERASDAVATQADRRERDERAANNPDDLDADAAGGDPEAYEEAAQQLIGEAAPEGEAPSQAASSDSPYSLEEKALSLVCSHSVHCAAHNIAGFVTGFIPAFLFRYVFFDSIALSASPAVSRWEQSVRFGLTIGALRCALRAVRCMLHAYRARRWVQQHKLVHARNNNPSPSPRAGGADDGDCCGESALRSGIPRPAAREFSFPWHSLAMLVACIAIVWKKQLLHGIFAD